MNKNMFKKGFTLIELLIVIAIIGILAVSLLPSVLSAPASARDAAKKSMVSSTIVAIEQYNATNGSLPTAYACLKKDATGDTAEKLVGYFKDGLPKVDSPQSVNVTGTACDGIVYCPMANNRYFVGVGMEKTGTGPGYYSTEGNLSCNGTENSGVLTNPPAAQVALWGSIQ